MTKLFEFPGFQITFNGRHPLWPTKHKFLITQCFSHKTKFFNRIFLNFNYHFLIGGCALANRLTENPKWNVLLIEAGDVESVFQSVPVLAPYSVFSRYNWDYSAEPQTGACLGLKFDPSYFIIKIYEILFFDRTTRQSLRLSKRKSTRGFKCDLFFDPHARKFEWFWSMVRSG